MSLTVLSSKVFSLIDLILLKAGAWGWPREMLWRGRWEGGSCLGTHVRIKDVKIYLKKKNHFNLSNLVPEPELVTFQVAWVENQLCWSSVTVTVWPQSSHLTFLCLFPHFLRIGIGNFIGLLSGYVKYLKPSGTKLSL